MINVHAKLGKLKSRKKGRGTIIHSVIISQEPRSGLLFFFQMHPYKLQINT